MHIAISASPPRPTSPLGLYENWVVRKKENDSTVIYTHLVGFEADEYRHAASKTVKEACELIDKGFEYVTEQDGVKLWRKRK